MASKKGLLPSAGCSPVGPDQYSHLRCPRQRMTRPFQPLKKAPVTATILHPAEDCYLCSALSNSQHVCLKRKHTQFLLLLECIFFPRQGCTQTQMRRIYRDLGAPGSLEPILLARRRQDTEAENLNIFISY